MNRPLRSLVVIGGHPQRVESLCDLLVDANGYDVIVMESIARGYSRIKQLTPDFVIVLMQIDDMAACQLLSMLKIDRDVSRIPLLTCAMRAEASELEDDDAAVGYCPIERG
jgi:DNA-binding NarL/FixJ family response regulator